MLTTCYHPLDYQKTLRQGYVDIAYGHVMLISADNLDSNCLFQRIGIKPTQPKTTHGRSFLVRQEQDHLVEITNHDTRERMRLWSYINEIYYDKPGAESISDDENFLRIWDIKSHSIFLNTLPAILTPQTLLLLAFDATGDLNSPCFNEKSTVEYMLELISAVHSTIATKHKFNSCNQNIACIIPIGIHRNSGSIKKDIFNTLTDAIPDMALSNLVQDGILVNLTTRDAGCQKIQKVISEFSNKEVIPTPITWVLFRKIIERHFRGKPFMFFEDVMKLAEVCSIPQSSLSSVLQFYHHFGVFVHYSKIRRLNPYVIIDQYWLFDQITENSAYDILDWPYGFHPEAIHDLYKHLLLIVSSIYYPSRFAPFMLPSVPLPALPSSSSAMLSTAPLYLTFRTNYLPPGFFSRLVVVMLNDNDYTFDLFDKQFSNRIELCYRLDTIIMTANKSSVSILVQRKHPRPIKYPTFLTTCKKIYALVKNSVDRVKKWLPGIDTKFTLECTPEQHSQKNQSASLQDENTSLGKKDTLITSSAEQQVWIYAQEVI